MVDCGECVKLGTDVLWAPSEVGGEGGPPLELMACAPSEEIGGVLHGPGEFEEEG